MPRRMRLGVNAVRLTRPFTGVGRCLECVLDEWSRMALPFERVTLLAPEPIDPARVLFPVDAFELAVGGPPGPDPFWEGRFLGPWARELDVLWGPSYTLPSGYAGPSLVSYHGPSEHRLLSWGYWRGRAYERLHRNSARRATGVVACSRAVKRRVVERFGVPPGKVSVAWNAASRLFAPVRDADRIARARERYLGRSDPFVLFVGKLVERHSIPNLIEAFARARDRFPGHQLVLVGPPEPGLCVSRIARRAGVEPAVIHHPFVAHEELPALYSAAEALVFPVTDSEGFGIPILEAMACGTPVLSASLGGVPEFASGAALLIDDSSIPSLEAGLVRLLSQPVLRRELSEAGLRRSREISWRVTAERILDRLVAIATAARRHS